MTALRLAKHIIEGGEWGGTELKLNDMETEYSIANEMLKAAKKVER